MIFTEDIKVYARDKVTGIFYEWDYVKKNLITALDEEHPMHNRFKWIVMGK